MTGSFALDWALLSLSLFNTILLLWLGTTILLNADRRNWGVWLMSGGILAGAAFFVSHTAILGHELTVNTAGLDFWWQVGWAPVTVAPYTWYIVVLWYGGFWMKPHPPLYRRHLPWLASTSGMAAGLVILLFAANPIPYYTHIVHVSPSGTVTLNAVPSLFLTFPAFMVICIGLSIDVLFRPALAERAINELARRRSRPWLLATAGALFAVSLLVAYFIATVIGGAVPGTPRTIDVLTVAWLDLILAALIAFASIVLGQAVVSYEVFTGKVLPRRGFSRHWRNILFIAGGYAAIVGWSLAIQLRPLYSLMLTTLLMVAFYALYSRQSLVERERFMARLRPFVSSQHLMTHLIQPEQDTRSRATELFQVICHEVLGTRQALLTPLGMLAPLAGPPLVYPTSNTMPAVRPPSDLNTRVIVLEAAQNDGYGLAIPLWSARGLIGAFLIGAKQDGGLYSQEEIEVAQASGERIVDMLAGEHMARRLMDLQRKRVAENRIVDLRTRRALHDDVLPALHTAILRLSADRCAEPAATEVIQLLTQTHRQIADIVRNIQSAPGTVADQYELGDYLRSTIDGEFLTAFATITWQNDEAIMVDRVVGEVLLGAVREATRNAAVHGRGNRLDQGLHLAITITRQKDLTIAVYDDGVGLDHSVNQCRQAGSGSGLALHSTMLAIVGGYLTVESPAHGGTEVRITVPISS